MSKSNNVTVTPVHLWNVCKGRKSNRVEWCRRVQISGKRKNSRTTYVTIGYVSGDIPLPLEFKLFHDSMTYRLTLKNGKVVMQKRGLVRGWIDV